MRALPTVLTVAVLLTAGCGSGSSTATLRACEDTRSHTRVLDHECSGTDGPIFAWRYYSTGSVPAVGSRVTGGGTTRPKGGTVEDAPGHGGPVAPPAEHVAPGGGAHPAPVEEPPVHIAPPVHVSVP